MGKRPGWLKSVKEWGKKFADKAGTFIDKAAKTIRNFQPVIDKVTDFIPGGDKIDEYVDKGLRIAEKTGEGLRDIGRGQNVGKVIANKTMDYIMDRDNKPKQKPRNKGSQNQQKSSFLNNKLN